MGFGVDRRCYEDGGTESQRRGGAESFFRKVSPIVVDFRTSSPGSLSLSLSFSLSCPCAHGPACINTRVYVHGSGGKQRDRRFTRPQKYGAARAG